MVLIPTTTNNKTVKKEQKINKFIHLRNKKGMIDYCTGQKVKHFGADTNTVVKRSTDRIHLGKLYGLT